VQTLHEWWLVALDADGREMTRTDLKGWEIGDRIRYGGHPLRVAANGTAWVESGHSLLRIASSGEYLDRLEHDDAPRCQAARQAGAIAAGALDPDSLDGAEAGRPVEQRPIASSRGRQADGV
jgi:hypothetical protein